MREELDYAGHGVGAVERALRAVNHFYLLDVVEGKIGIIEIAAGFVGGRAIDENFCVVGISAVEEEGSQTADRAGAGETDSRLRVEKIGKRNGLTLGDLFAGKN